VGVDDCELPAKQGSDNHKIPRIRLEHERPGALPRHAAGFGQREPAVEVAEERRAVRDRGERLRTPVVVLRAALERPQVAGRLRIEERLDVAEVTAAEFEPRPERGEVVEGSSTE